MIHRRAFLAALGLGALAAPPALEAQQAGRVYRLGVLSPTVPFPGGAAARISTDLGELGYVEGRNLVVERRHANGQIDRLTELARELVQLQVDVIVAVASVAIRAAKDATMTIPIVMFVNVDPVAAGFVASLARPGGNLTGILIAPDGTLAAKKLELLKEAVPRATRIALLAPGDPTFQPQVQEAQKAASSLGVELVVVEVRGVDYERAFAAMVVEKSKALLVGATTFFVRDRKQIIRLAAKHRLPAIYEWPEHAEDGGLMAYGANRPELVRRTAVYIDRIFKGAKPDDLPIEQPSTFELVINLKTARSLGLTLPQSLLRRADRTIE